MKQNNLWIILGVIFIACFVCIVGRSNKLSTLTNDFSQKIELTDLSYRKQELSLLGNSLLFYGVTFKGLPQEYKIDKMALEKVEKGIKITLLGVRFNVDELLKQNEYVTDKFQRYVPYESAFTQPLETLALLGVQEVNFNTTFVVRQEQNGYQFLGEITDKKLGSVLFEFAIPVLDMQPMDKLSIATLKNNSVQNGTFSVTADTLISAYIQYAKSVGYEKPTGWPKGVILK